MIKILNPAVVLVVALSLAACNQTGAGGSIAAGAAAALDPTGLSGAALDMAQAQADADASASMDFSSFAPRLSDIAAGNIAPPNYMGEVNKMTGRIMARESARMARNVAQAGVDAALSGGLSLAGAGPQLAMQGIGTGVVAAQVAAAQSQAGASAAMASAQFAASRFLPDADLPAEAQAALSVLNGGGSSASWQSPSGASGKVSLKTSNRKLFGGMDCRILRREARSGGQVRTGEMLACRNNGEWYDLS
ncbi:hypothetical protein [Microvirga arabica]|uniref:hypothetical protein n=1 Tax=Microvirga arabica TaxID=1128671 RepID=UPI00193A3B94|nr:hypothetical protein [Microvirga arabica]MBM1171169.1 hypothetical protein [Microvirga arabica]